MNDALDLVVENMQETPTNNKKTFAKWVLGYDLGSFAQALMNAWSHADGENQRRLAIAYPQIAECMIEYNTLPEKKREKYLKKTLNIKD